jgi:DNA (cytosine-5)-methyltransferase 1
MGLPRWRTFRQATAGLENIENHHHVVFPEKRLRYYRLLGPGQNWRNLPAELQKEALGNAFNSGGGKTGFLRRLAWDEPSPTLVTHPAMPATDLAHPALDRPLSIEEYKRIQEFPDHWQIEGSLIEQYRQIGNAVPVSLGFAIGKLLMDLMAGNEPAFQGDFKYSRYNLTNADEWMQDFEARSKKQLAMFE